ncbi:unnamed protein product [Closterium sp. NIES-54]
MFANSSRTRMRAPSHVFPGVSHPPPPPPPPPHILPSPAPHIPLPQRPQRSQVVFEEVRAEAHDGKGARRQAVCTELDEAVGAARYGLGRERRGGADEWVGE